MKIQIDHWLAPPVFEGDKEKTWRAGLLNAIIIVCIIFSAVVFSGNLLGGRIPTTTLVIDGIMFTVSLWLRRLLFNGKVTLTGITLIIIGFIVLAAGIASLGTIRTPSTAVFLLLVIVAGLLFDLRGLLASILSSSLAVLGLILAENAGILPRPDYTVNITQWITYTTLFGLTGALTYFSHHATLQALNRMFKESTKRKQAQALLQENEARYRQIFETNLAVKLIIDPADGRITAANEAACRFYGYDAQTLTSLQVMDINILSEEEVRQEMERTKTEERLFFNFRHRLASGEIRDVEVYSGPVQSGDKTLLYSIIHDVTERKRAEDALQSANNQLAQRIEELSTLNHISQKLSTVINLEANLKTLTMTMVQLFKARSSIATMLNPAGTELVVVSHHNKDGNPTDIIGLTFPLSSNHADRQVIETGRSVLVTPDTLDLLDEAARKRLKTRGVHCLMISPLLVRGKAIGTLTITTAQTGRIFTPAEMRLAETVAAQTAGAIETARLFDKLRDARDAAEAANRAKSAFLSSMSHELRTPLNGILGYTQIFKRDAGLTAKQQQGIDIIHRSGEHLLTMIGDILDISKIEADRMDLLPVEFHLPQFLQVIVDMFRLRAEQKGLTFTYQPGPNLPQALLADETRLRQILLNLLGNAVKFTAEGNVTFQVTMNDEREIVNDKTASVHHSSFIILHFNIIDTGIGIAPERQAEVFEPFRQVGDKRIQSQGTGLGLSISQRLVRMMGGELHIESTGAGSRFWFELSLPLATWSGEMKKLERRRVTGYTRITKEAPFKISTSSSRSHAERGNELGISGEAPFKILLVDDFAQNRAVLKEFLASLGFAVDEADDGLAAMAQVAQFKPDLILMDLVMPGMDGLEATRQIRQLPERQNIPIIALSASISPEARQKSIAAGCNDFLPKPFETEAILEKLQHYLPLQWLYADKHQPEAEDESSPSPIKIRKPVLTEIQNINPPPQAELEILLTLAMTGDIMGIEERLSALEKQNAQYAPFAARLNRLAANLKISEMEQFIRDYLEEK